MRWLLLFMTACIPENSPIMRPGEQCISCHDLEGNAYQWTAAGTVFGASGASKDEGVEGVRIFITDKNDFKLTLFSNSAGNFYTAERLVFPISVQVERDGTLVSMTTQPEHGDCNRCHGVPPTEGAPGRVYVPE